MRAFLSSLIPLALLFSVDVDLSAQTVGVAQAQAADFTGRIKRVKIRRRRVGTSFQVVTELPTGPSNTASTMQVSLEAIGEAPPAELESGVAQVVREDARYTFALPEGIDGSDVLVIVQTASIENAVALEELLVGATDGSFGEPVPVGGAEAVVRARQTQSADGVAMIHVRVASARGASLSTLEEVMLKSLTGLDGSSLAINPLTQSAQQTYEVDISENLDDPLFGAYTAEAIWLDSTGEVVDETRYVLDEGMDAEGPRVERVAVRASSRGTTLLTRVSTPDASPVLLEASVVDGEGNTVISLADEAPQWTERQYTATGLSFDDDPTDSTYLVQMTTLDAEGNPTSEQLEVELLAERPNEAGEIETTLFSEDRAQMALIPGEEDGSWQIFLRAVGDIDAASVELIFEEPFEGPAPLETEISGELTQVWRQFRQRDSTPAEGDAVRQVSVKVNPESDDSSEASGLQAQGPVLSTGNSVEDIDGFMQSLSGDRTRRRIRARATRRVRR